MGELITTRKGSQYTIELALTELDSSGNRVASNLTGVSSVTFTVFDEKENTLFTANCTVDDAANGIFSFLLTTEFTKRAGSFSYNITAVYPNGHIIPWDGGIFKIDSK